MDSTLETFVKIFCCTVLVFAVLAYWLLPKMKFAKHFSLNEKVFIITQYIGIFCSAVGLLATFIWSNLIVETHLMWLIILPYPLIWMYWLLVIKMKKSTEITSDEKLDFNMKKAGYLTMASSIPAMVIMFQLYYNEILAGLIWFPYYFFVTIFLFSTFTLLFFKKE